MKKFEIKRREEGKKTSTKGNWNFKWFLVEIFCSLSNNSASGHDPTLHRIAKRRRKRRKSSHSRLLAWGEARDAEKARTARFCDALFCLKIKRKLKFLFVSRTNFPTSTKDSLSRLWIEFPQLSSSSSEREEQPPKCHWRLKKFLLTPLSLTIWHRFEWLRWWLFFSSLCFDCRTKDWIGQ